MRAVAHEQRFWEAALCAFSAAFESVPAAQSLVHNQPVGEET